MIVARTGPIGWRKSDTTVSTGVATAQRVRARAPRTTLGRQSREVRVDSVEQDIQQLKVVLAELEARVQRDGTAQPVIERRTDRRQLLAKAAGGAAAAVVGGTALVLGQASPAAAATGTFDGSPAVTASGTGAASTAVQATGGAGDGGVGVNGTGRIGVLGTGQGSWGLYGAGQSGVGGASTGGAGTWGVQGTAIAGTGVQGVTTSGIGLDSAAGVEGIQLRLGGGTKPPLTSTKPWLRGDMSRDTNGDLWLCVAPGVPGTWRRVAGPSTAGALVPLPTPVRVYDSRPGQVPIAVGPKTPLPANVPRTLDLKNNLSGVPAGATAVLVSLVATGTTTNIGGYMAIFSNAIDWPGTSNLNCSGAGQTVAVTTLTAVDSQARAKVYAGSITDVVVDVLGYYQ
jgi:hypothetical protein